MPYISTERVSEIRKEIKKEFPEFKFSIRNRHHSTICVSILAGPIEMITTDNLRRNERVNHYYIDKDYEDTPEVRDILQKIYKIMNKGNYTVCEDGDYGSIPSFYCDIEIGDWNKPYKVIK